MKPLYILAAALTALPVLATAEVRLYGEIKSGVEASRIKSGGSSVSHSGVYDSGSYIGLRGSLPIGSGNNVLFQAEQDAPVGSRRMSRTVWHSPSPPCGQHGRRCGRAVWEILNFCRLCNEKVV
ncbi:porin [Neisseria sicca]|uniref:porin n=1 Tax=Neisseria sicca TaxID=490 RepID=UPI001F45FA0E|nr:porin [Neisseria sicca]